MPKRAAGEDAGAQKRLTAAQVVHSTNKIGTKRGGEARIIGVSALFHSHAIDLIDFCYVAIF